MYGDVNGLLYSLQCSRGEGNKAAALEATYFLVFHFYRKTINFGYTGLALVFALHTFNGDKATNRRTRFLADLWSTPAVSQKR